MTVLNINGKTLDLSTPKVIGILNITNDSFFDRGKYLTEEKILEKTKKMLKEGASIIDIGAQSSRPGADSINSDVEKNNLLSTISLLKQYFPEIIISIDTYRSDVAKSCIDIGAHIINDISAGELDKNMFNVVAKLNIPYIMMHMQGIPKNMQKNPNYLNLIDDVFNYFKKKLKILTSKGAKQIIIDPGFGFGKTIKHNYKLINNLNKFKSLNVPILIGVSRKSMIYKLLSSEPKNALNGTTALHVIGLLNGANMLRVHDVKEANECIKIVNFAKNN